MKIPQKLLHKIQIHKMDKIVILRVFTSLLMLFCLFFLMPVLIAVLDGDAYIISAFIIPLVVVLCIGLPIVFFTRHHKGVTNLKQGILLVPLCWIAISIIGSIPYMLSGVIESFSAALFETSSGLTTTGATVLLDIESVPRAILFWRALTHWLGGMGIVVLAVALFPQVGMGGNIMLAAESPGPTLEKVTPKINEMAKILWIMYTVLTAIEMVLLMLGGMDWFDAITHSFATLATGGFSTKNDSIAAFSPYIQTVITVFMLLAGINFAMYFAIIKGNISSLWKDSEFKGYIFVVVVVGVIIAGNLLIFTETNISKALRDSFFQVAAIITTTGFVSQDYEVWPYFSQALLFLLMFIGGCAGSTGGGIKVIRVITTLKYIQREIIKFFTPKRVQRIKISKRSVDEDYIKLVMFFILCYFLILLLTTLVVSLDNFDILTSFTTALATLGNIGPGLGAVGPTDNYAMFSPWLKVFLSLVMITGRLELFTVLILFSPRFWK